VLAQYHPFPTPTPLLQDFRVYQLRKSSGHTTAHQHPHIELHYCEEGSGFFEVTRSRQRFPLLPGHVTLLLGPVPHQLYASSSTEYARRVVHFPLALPTSSVREPTNSLLHLLPTNTRPCRQFSVPAPMQKKLCALMQRLYVECADWSRSSRPHISRLLLEILRCIDEESPTTAVTNERPTPHEEWLVERVERMNGQDGTAIFHVGDLAKRLEISEGHLRRIFRRATGMNLREHLNTTRFSLAHALLHAGESVTETALACQYNDVSSFSRAFKLQSGVAPTVYKAWLVEGAQ
jgi:AraC-like DNA-binding protein